MPSFGLSRQHVYNNVQAYMLAKTPTHIESKPINIKQKTTTFKKKALL